MTNEGVTFIDISEMFWSRFEGDLRNVNFHEGSSSMVIPTSPKFNGKLQGDYTWPFSIDLPKEVSVHHDNCNKVFTLLETFNEQYTGKDQVHMKSPFDSFETSCRQITGAYLFT